MKQAVILAGGKGTRLKARLGRLPKPLIPIGGKPLLAHQLDLCRKHDFTDVVILLSHEANAIMYYVGDGEKWGIRARCEVEPTPLGTAGTVLSVLPSLADQFLVLYGDLMVNVDLDRLWKSHNSRKASATLLLHPNDHPSDSDLVEIDGDGWIRAFRPRPHPADECFQNLVNAALYVVNREALEAFGPVLRPMDFGKDVFPTMLADKQALHGYRSPEYIKDIGTPTRYDQVCSEYERGVVERSSLEQPQTAVFLDRDGTLNKEEDRITAPDKLTLLPGVGEAIRRLNHNGIRAVVVTNQPIVAKGFCTEADIELVHRKLETLLGTEHAFVDRIYYCPHHPERGFPGERPDLKVQCECRKPRPGMIRQAIADLNIDAGKSWLIGDRTVDIATARKCGLRSILVRTGHGGLDGLESVEPDFVFDNVSQAVQFILEHSRSTP